MGTGGYCIEMNVKRTHVSLGNMVTDVGRMPRIFLAHSIRAGEHRHRNKTARILESCDTSSTLVSFRNGRPVWKLGEVSYKETRQSHVMRLSQ